MEINGHSGLLAKLKELQMQRSEQSQFSSNIAFNNWADQVAALLSSEREALQSFLHTIKNVNFLYRAKHSTLNGENEAIGILNLVILRMEHAHLTKQGVKEIENFVTVDSQKLVENADVEHAGNRIHGSEQKRAKTWHLGFFGQVLVAVVAGCILLVIAAIAKNAH